MYTHRHCTHTHSDTHTRTHIEIKHVHTQRHIHYTHTQTHVYTQRHTHYICAQTHTRVHTEAHTQTDTRLEHVWPSCSQTAPEGPWLLQLAGKPGSLRLPLPPQPPPVPKAPPPRSTGVRPQHLSPPPAAWAPPPASPSPALGVSFLSVSVVALFLAFEIGLSWCHCGFALPFPRTDGAFSCVYLASCICIAGF